VRRENGRSKSLTYVLLGIDFVLDLDTINYYNFSMSPQFCDAIFPCIASSFWPLQPSVVISAGKSRSDLLATRLAVCWTILE